MVSKLQLLKLVGLWVGCLAKFITGSLFVFAVYQDAIKDTFNYTQTEVEVFSSMLNIGLGFGFLPGMFYDRFGPQWTSVVGLIISVPAYTLLWSTSKNIHFYSHNSWLVAIYFFFCGIGSVFTYMVALNTNLINFHSKHSGKVVGFLNAFFAGSPSVYSVIYYNCFTHGDITDTKNQDFPGFMLLFAISFGVADIMCIIFLRRYDALDNTYVQLNEEIKHSYAIQNEDNSSLAQDNDPPYDSTTPLLDGLPKNAITPTATDSEQLPVKGLKELIKDRDFHLVVYSFSFASVIGLVYANNITLVSKTVDLDAHDNVLTVIIPVTNAIISASVGFVSDVLKERIPRIWIVIVGNLAFIGSQVLIFFLAYDYAALIFATVLVGTGIAIIWSICPTVVKEMYNVENFGRNWGLCILVAALLGAGLQAIFGLMYDSKASSDNTCYGMVCIKGGVALMITCGVLSVIFGVVLQLMKRLRQRRSTRPPSMTD